MGTPSHQMREKPVRLPRLRVFSEALMVGLMMQFGLSRKHAEVVGLLAEGLQITAIAGVMCMTETSTRTYTKHIYSQLGVHTQAQVVAVVYKAILEALSEATAQEKHAELRASERDLEEGATATKH